MTKVVSALSKAVGQLLDPAVLRDAQEHPQNYRHLLVRITGYNAYFTGLGKEIQDEIIARESHAI